MAGKKNLYTIQVTFWALVAIFVLILAQFFLPTVSNLLKGSFLFLLPFAVFSLLGAVLVFLTYKKKVQGKLKKFLILTGVCALGFFVSVLLHNFFYALGIVTRHIIGLHYLMEVLHGLFFIIAIPVCPVGFLVGVAGSIASMVNLKKKGK